MILKNKVIIVTGGNGHIGQAITKEIIALGGKTILISRSVNKTNQFIKNLNLYQKKKCYPIKADLTKEKDLIKIKKHIHKKFKFINGIVNNAYSGKTGSLDKLKKKDFENAFNLNLFAPFKIILDLKDLLLKGERITKQSSSIINIASMYGIVSPDKRIYEDKNKKYYNPAQYGSTKAGLIQITKYLACNLSPKKIRVNSVSLGPFPNKKVSLGFKRKLMQKVPMGRVANATEAAKPVAFLLSNNASFINGADIRVDGGWTAW